MHLPPYRFRTDENTVCRSHSTVHQFNHFTTLLWTSEFTQVSPFSSMVAKGHFSWCTFLNVWKCLLFAGDGFAGAWLIDLAMLSIIHKTFLQMAPWFLSIRLAALLKFWRNFFWFKSFAHVQSTSKRNCASFLSFVNAQRIQSDLGKFPHKCYSYSQEKSKRQCLLFFFSWMKASETFERLSVFADRAIDFHDFQEQIRQRSNGRHVCY